MQATNETSASVLSDQSVGPLIVLYGGTSVAVYRCADAADANAKNRLFQLPRTPANTAFCQAVADLTGAK